MNALASDSTRDEFLAEVEQQIRNFESALLVRRVAQGQVQLCHYHAILLTLFHQTRSGPYTFAAASANCEWRHEVAKEYLLLHAEEEKVHWKWVLDDLASTGYSGPDPRKLFPHPTCEAYISFNERMALRMPVARLAIASVLEGIGASFGGHYGGKFITSIGLKPEQATFFLSHGETDKAHREDLSAVIHATELSAHEWGWMSHAARMAGLLYRGMYSHEGFAE